jgi:hypothetical protein
MLFWGKILNAAREQEGNVNGKSRRRKDKEKLFG